MRQSVRSTVSSASASSSGVSQRSVRVILLNKQELTVVTESKARIRDIFHQVCDHVGLREIEYFGLAQLIDGEFFFADQETKLHKHFPKGWKSKSQESAAISFYLRVIHYVPHVSVLRERATRQQYYLQLKDNLLNHNQYVSEDKCFILAGYALQADKGNCTQGADTPYFDPREYFPAWVIEERGVQFIKQHLPSMHSDLCGMSRLEAMMLFIKDVSLSPHAHNLHFYKLKKRKCDDLGTAWLAVCPSGIQIYEEVHCFKSLLSTFAWPDIKKLHVEKKKFEIRAEGVSDHKFVYFTNSEEHGQRLLSLCRASHLFQMALQPKMAELRLMEAEDRRYRETYIYSENTEFSWSDTSANSTQTHGTQAAAAPTPAKPSEANNSQRVSVISNTSSNTTSGIVSDRMHASLDSEEEERQQNEIIIDSPPAPSAASSYGSLWPSTPQSLQGLSPIATPGVMTRVPSLQHSNGGHAVPTPVNAHVERLMLATPMTVSSSPVQSQQHTARPEFSTPISRPFDTPYKTQSTQLLPGPQSTQLLPATQNTQLLPEQVQYLQLQPQNQLQRKHHIQQLQQQLEAAQLAYVQYGSMQLSGRYNQHTPAHVVDGFSRSLENGLHDHHTYENIPPLSTPEVTRLRGGATVLASLPCTPQSTRAVLADMRRRSSTVAEVGHCNHAVVPSVTRAKSAATDARPKLKEDDCPVHSNRSQVVDEIRSKNVSLPLLTALCNDSTLMSSACTCNPPAQLAPASGKRFSYAQPPSVRRLLEPGTVARPMSWHSDHLSLEQMMRQSPQKA